MPAAASTDETTPPHVTMSSSGSGGTGDLVFMTITNGGSAYQQVSAADEKNENNPLRERGYWHIYASPKTAY
jgi:hypothetical protein